MDQQTKSDHKRTLPETQSVHINGSSLNGVGLPLVSIIITNYNYSSYLTDAIESILNQDYPNIELIVADDASTDDSPALISDYEQAGRLTAVYSEDNNGQMGNAIKGLDVSSGEFVAFLDADDWLFTSYISHHVQAHLASPRPLGLSSSSLVHVNGDGDLIARGKKKNLNYDPASLILQDNGNVPRLPMISDESFETLVRNTHFSSSTRTGWQWSQGGGNFYRRDLIEHVRPNQDDPVFTKTSKEDGFFHTVDSFFNFSVHWLTGSVYINLPLSAYRLHGSNGWSRGLTYPGMSSPEAGNRKYMPRRRCEFLRNIVERAEHFAILTRSRKNQTYSPNRFWEIYCQAALQAGLKPERAVRDYQMDLSSLKNHIRREGAAELVRQLRKQISKKQIYELLNIVFDGDVPPDLSRDILYRLYRVYSIQIIKASFSKKGLKRILGRLKAVIYALTGKMRERL